MRYDKKRLDDAYSTVGLFADSTWYRNDLYIQANQQLWKRECALKGRPDNVEMPRSVLDTIPTSRLAQYGTYWYDETRECAYKPASNYTTTIAQPEKTYINQEFRNEDLFQSREVEKLFEMFTDTSTNNKEIEHQCKRFLKNFEMKQVRPDKYKLTRVSDSFTKLNKTESFPKLVYQKVSDKTFRRPRNLPRGEINNFDELKLQMQLHSEEIRAIWDRTSEKDHYVNGTKFYPKFCSDESDNLPPPLNYEMVPNLQWLNISYPLRHSDFRELSALSSDIGALCVAPHRPLHVLHRPPTPPPPHRPIRPATIPLIPIERRETPPARRLYSAVLQNRPEMPTLPILPTLPIRARGPPGAMATAVAENADELDELEREAIEQYRPGSEDSIISAKFQELERLALEQYSASATETSAGGMGKPVESAGNALSPPHEPPCGGKPNPYAALLLANWNNVIVGMGRELGLYRFRLFTSLGTRR